MEEHETILQVLLGYLLVATAILYITLALSLTMDVDWRIVFQSILIFGPFGSFSVIVAKS